MTIWTKAAAALSKSLKAVSNETLTITRGADTGTLSASFGTSTFEIVEGGGSIIEWISEDILCDTADYKFNGVAVKPARGDQLVRTLPSGLTVTYEVHHPSKNQKPYALNCQDLRLRIHAKRVGN
jgi:hypothetical protein